MQEIIEGVVHEPRLFKNITAAREFYLMCARENGDVVNEFKGVAHEFFESYDYQAHIWFDVKQQK